MRYVLLQQRRLGEISATYLVKVTSDKEFEDTLRYLDDCGIQFDVMELGPMTMTPGELSDLLAPRDD